MRGEIRQQGDGFLSFFEDEQDKNKLFLEKKKLCQTAVH
jgi:hypothetical protein